VTGVAPFAGTSGYAKTLGLQVAIAAVVALAFGVAMGPNAGLSALAGGAVCFIPSAFFAWRLRSSARRGWGAFGATFLVGELAKLALSAALLAAIFAWYRDAVFAAVVVSYIITLQAYLLALLVA
jgi:ATP synthase protein I